MRESFVDRVFVLRERAGPDMLGVVVYGHAPLELALRNLATRGRFRRRPDRLAAELRILRRLVIHPDVRGCGLGRWLVRRTLPMVGVRFIECLAAMGSLNPVLERAGMTRIGRCSSSRRRTSLIRRARDLKFDPRGPDFARHIRRRPRVRRLVETGISQWTRASHARTVPDLRDRRADSLAATFRHLLAEPPTYYLWDRIREFPNTSRRHGSALRGPSTDRETAAAVTSAVERGRHRP